MKEKKKQPKRLFRVEITREIYLRVLVWARDDFEARKIAEDYELADEADEMERFDEVWDTEEVSEDDALYGSEAFDADAKDWLAEPKEVEE